MYLDNLLLVSSKYLDLFLQFGHFLSLAFSTHNYYKIFSHSLTLVEDRQQPHDRSDRSGLDLAPGQTCVDLPLLYW